jgi:hypothetical protein
VPLHRKTAELRPANGRGRPFPHNQIMPVPTQPTRSSPHEWRYNVGVSEPHDSEQESEPDHKHQRHAIYATETVGLLLIAFLLLMITIIRYWHAIRWSLR